MTYNLENCPPCSRDYIGDINQGKKYFNKDLTYPLRKRSHK